MCLAPMADVTDPPFRSIIAKYGKPDITWTEFVSCDGLMSDGRTRILKDLVYTEQERPIVMQVFGSKPENFTPVAELAQELGFDGIDINMGCPDKSVEKQGAGAALAKTPKLAQELIQATKKGAGNLPVSVKIRLGYNKDELDTWLSHLLEVDPAAVTIHLRTRKEMSKVPAHWKRATDAVKIRDNFGSKALILGNGDVMDVADAKKKADESGMDGIMLGRAIFGNPWLFNQNVERDKLSIEEVLRVMVEHTWAFERQMGDIKSFAVMKKHYKAYVNGFPGAKELRMRLMEKETAQEVADEVKRFLNTLS